MAGSVTDSFVKNQERNNEMKKNLGNKNWMFPMPVLMIGTYGADGTPDVMNAAWEIGRASCRERV